MSKYNTISIFLFNIFCQEGRQCRVVCRLGRVNMATADEVDVEFVSNIK